MCRLQLPGNGITRSRLPPATEYDVRPGDDVYVFREKDKRWHGPYNVLKRRNKQVYVDIGGTETQFNLSQVLPDSRDVLDHELVRLLDAVAPFKSNPPPGILLTEVLHPADARGQSPAFDAAKAKELQGLAQRGVYEVVWKKDVPCDANVLGGRFVLSIKNKDTQEEAYKARFVVQGHTDAEKNLLVHSSPNLKQSSIRLLLAQAATFGFQIWSQDVRQAYLQSAERLMREIYVRPTKEFKLSHDQLLRLLKPLYGLADSGDYWHITFSSHLRRDLQMIPTLNDLSLFFKTVKGELAGMIGAYVDDTIGAGTAQFSRDSLVTEKRFDSSPRQKGDFKFARMEIESLPGGGYKIHQHSFAEKLQLLPETCSFSQYRSCRHTLAWLVHTRPDIACAVNMAAQVTEQHWSVQDVRNLNRIIRVAKDNSSRGLLQQPLDVSSLSLKVYIDAAFANSPDLRSQLGFIVLLCDGHNRCNILHYSSYMAKRVTRSVLGAEVSAFADGFDYGYALKIDIERITGKLLLLTLLTDSKSLFDVLVTSSTTTEKRLMIDIAAIREAYQSTEIHNVAHVRGDHNPGDAFTKVGKCLALNRILESGILDLPVNQWIVRSDAVPLRLSDKKKGE